MSVQILEVTPDVLCVRRASYLTCSYLVRRNDGVVAIDAGMKTDGSDLVAGLAHWEQSVSDVRAILLTHWHNDHSAGAAEIQRRSGCAVYYSAAEAPRLMRQTATGGLAGCLSDAIPEVGPLVLAKGLLGSAPMAAVEATRHVGDGDEVEGFVVLATPGHTAGHLSFWLPESRMLFAGDAFATVHGKLQYMARPVTEDLQAARASMIRCAALDLRWACTGHREPLQVEPAELDRFRRRVESPEWPLLG